MAKSKPTGDAREDLLREVASSVQYWTRTAMGGLNAQGPDPLSSSCVREYKALALALDSPQLHAAFRSVVHEALVGLAHSILVTLDGGTRFAAGHGIQLTDGNGGTLGGDLHERLFDFVEDESIDG